MKAENLLMYSLDPSDNPAVMSVRSERVAIESEGLKRLGHSEIRVGDTLESAMPVEVWMVAVGLANVGEFR